MLIMMQGEVKYWVNKEKEVGGEKISEGHEWEERQGGDEMCVREREQLSSLFPQHQLCGFYEEQMFTT